MSKAIKNQKAILAKLGIEKLNAMQLEAHSAIRSNSELILLSPTGTGKTLAFLLPIIQEMDTSCLEVQVLILVPTRELAIQIEQVTREMGAGYKTNAVYGGRSFSKDKVDLKHRPAILIGTPGRVSDHIKRGTFPTSHIKTLVLDEFDKSLEIGFEEQMQDILSGLRDVEKKILTSATQEATIPGFVRLRNPVTINYLKDGVSQLTLKTVLAPTKNKQQALVDLLCQIGNQPGIIFCNFKDTINGLSAFLKSNGIEHGLFYGGMEQVDRERALIKFRNGTHQIIIATDLAARGIDISELKFIVHYQMPSREHEFTHRNGRTARMNSEGTAYILKGKNERTPEYMPRTETVELIETRLPKPSEWQTIFISGGRKDKISKGDIAGLFMKVGGLKPEQLGIIELKSDCAFVGVSVPNVLALTQQLDNGRIKKRKVRVYEI